MVFEKGVWTVGTGIMSAETSLDLVRRIIDPIYPLNGRSVSSSEYEKYLVHKMAELLGRQSFPATKDEIDYLTIMGNTSLYLAEIKKMMRLMDANQPATLSDISSRLETIENYDDGILASFADRLAKYLGFDYFTVNSCSIPKRTRLPFDFKGEKEFVCPNKYYMLAKNNSKTGIVAIVRRHKDYLNSVPKKCLDYYIILNNRHAHYRNKEVLQIRDPRALEIVIEDGRNYLDFVKKILNAPFVEPIQFPGKKPKYMNEVSGVKFVDYNKTQKEYPRDPTNGRSYMSTHLFVRQKLSGKIFEIKVTFASPYLENHTNPYFGHPSFRKMQKREIFDALKKC